MIFNSDGVLVKTTDSNSNSVKINLDSAKGISTIEDACGDKLTFNRNSEHCITKVTNSAGKARIFRYDNNDRLIQIQNPDNGITFEYDNDGSMISVTDTDGYKVCFGYTSLNSGKKFRLLQNMLLTEHKVKRLHSAVMSTILQISAQQVLTVYMATATTAYLYINLII